MAQKFGIPHWSTDLGECLAQPGVEAAILATPTQMHAKQAVQCMRAGKHVQVEIPMADSVADAEMIVKVQKETGLVAMAGHTRRFNPSHQWVHKQHQGRRAEGAADGRADLLLPPHQHERARQAAQLDGPPAVAPRLPHRGPLCVPDRSVGLECYALQGPAHPDLKIAMDMSIGMKVPSGAICTLSLSFNNDGPLGTFFRYICDNGTYLARYDELVDGKNNPIDVSKVDVSMNGIELQDREFFAAIAEGREPNASVAQALPAMQTLGKLEDMLNS